jgi:hypothetical protein
MLQNYKHHRTIFTCDLHEGHCCPRDSFELEIEDDWFFDDCEGGPYVGLSVGFEPSSLWYMLKYWWKHGKWHQIYLNMDIDSLKGLNQRIEELLPQLEKRKVIMDKKFGDAEKHEPTLAEKLLKEAKDAKK